MKKIILGIIAVSLITLIGFVHAQTHDKTFDNKSVSSITFDDANSPGTVKVKSPTSMTSNYTITLPAETGTLITTASTGTGTQTVTLSGAVTGSGTTAIAATLANNIVQTGNVNWNSINGLSTINTGAVNWPSVNALATVNSGAVNWPNINLTATINNGGVNWNSVIASQVSQGLTTGINWNDLNPTAGGINWMVVTKTAADNSILCVKGGQIGKCSASFSASGAGSCTCI